MRIFDAIGDYFTTADESAQAVSDVATTAAEVVSDSNGFTAMLAMLTSADDDTQTQAQDATIADIQSQFTSSLGIPGLDEDVLSSLTSDSGLAKMQSAFLAMLQADLLSSSEASSEVTGETAVSDAEAESVALADGETGWDSFMNAAFGEDGVDWNDGFDAVNLLHHIPIVADVYQSVSSTHISAVSDLAGSFMYGGPAGLAYSAANLTVQEFTGSSITTNLWELGYDWLFNRDVTGGNESLTEAVAGEGGEAVAHSAYQFARRQFDADAAEESGN